MKKMKLYFTAFLVMLVLVFAGCGSSDTTKESAQQEMEEEETLTQEEIDASFEDELTPLEGDELAMMEDIEGDGSLGDEELTPLDEEEMEQDEAEASDETDTEGTSGNESEKESDSGNGAILVKEDGTYTSKEEVAVYLHTYGHLPSNYITKAEAKELGWVSSEGNLDEVAPGKSIGGDKFGNYDKMLPEEDGRTYQECDIDYDGGTRNSKRIVYSNDGLIFYTEDHYETFEQLY